MGNINFSSAQSVAMNPKAGQTLYRFADLCPVPMFSADAGTLVCPLCTEAEISGVEVRVVDGHVENPTFM